MNSSQIAPLEGAVSPAIFYKDAKFAPNIIQTCHCRKLVRIRCHEGAALKCTKV